MLQLFSIAFVLFLTAMPMSLNAASFDCSKATTKVEKMICEDKALSDLDEQLSAAYHRVLDNPSNDKESIKKDQRAWLKKLKELDDAGQMAELYIARIEVLNDIVENAGGTVQSTPQAEPEKILEQKTSPEKNVSTSTAESTNENKQIKKQGTAKDRPTSKTSKLAISLATVFSIGLYILYIMFGMKSNKFYAVIEFWTLHSSSITPVVYHLVLKGKDSNAVRFIALLFTGLIACCIPAIGIFAIIINYFG